jgi:hypothetical protein
MSNLFTAVSVEQQEIVAGGGNTTLTIGGKEIIINGPAALFGTYFNGKNTVQNGGSNSNWNGSVASGSQGIVNVKSIGLSFLQS